MKKKELKKWYKELQKEYSILESEINILCGDNEDLKMSIKARRNLRKSIDDLLWEGSGIITGTSVNQYQFPRAFVEHLLKEFNASDPLEYWWNHWKKGNLK